jgi:hypothetical protein
MMRIPPDASPARQSLTPPKPKRAAAANRNIEINIPFFKGAVCFLEETANMDIQGLNSWSGGWTGIAITLNSGNNDPIAFTWSTARLFPGLHLAPKERLQRNTRLNIGYQ